MATRVGRALARTLMTLWLGAALCALPGALAGCAEESDTALEGSLGARYDLAWDRVRVLRFGADLSIEYVRDVEGGTLIPFKLVAEDVAADALEVGTAALSVGRVMAGGDAGALPALESGRLTLEDRIAPGASLGGAFDLRFVDGSALSGRFRAVVEGPGGDEP